MSVHNGHRTPVFIALLAAMALPGLAAHAQAGNYTRNIMVTGYWPPTNWMVEQFSTDPELNPGGWLGENWEGRGYNIYSYFPTFPGQSGPNWGPGTGDFRVDYQDTSADWHRITEELRPAAILTFSRGFPGSEWEIESRHMMRESSQWAPDYEAPFRPTPDLPIVQQLDPGTILHSSLPMENIRDAVADANIIDDVYIDTGPGFGGNFLSEFIGLHGVWYHEMNKAPDAEYRNFAAGHIHVGIDTPLEAAEQATEITLRELTTYLDIVIPAPSTLAAVVLGLGLASRRRR